MVNWFEIFADRLTAIEEGQKELRLLLTKSSPAPDAEPFGDFGWLQGVCAGVPPSTLRIKSAAGEIPGVKKFGKRVLYDKAEVVNWLRSQSKPTKPDAAELEQAAEQQVNAQLEKRRNISQAKHTRKTTTRP